MLGRWETFIAKPAAVLKSERSGMMDVVKSVSAGLMGGDHSIRVDELAAAMIDMVSNGCKEHTVSNRALTRVGRKALT